jgi:hypothetical protein
LLNIYRLGDGGFLLASLQHSAFQFKSMQSSILGMKKEIEAQLPAWYWCRAFYEMGKSCMLLIQGFILNREALHAPNTGLYIK